jgi:peroxiredoxin
MMRKYGWLCLLMMMTSFGVFAGGYRIEVHLLGAPDSLFYLAHYIGGNTYLDDTAFVDKTGKAVFAGNLPLPAGIYIIAGQKNNKYLEVILDENQDFSISGDVTLAPSGVKFTGSGENEWFYEYICRNTDHHMKVSALNTRLERFKDLPDSLQYLSGQIERSAAEFGSFRDDMIRKHPGTLLSTILRAMKEPDLIQALPDRGGVSDSTRSYLYFREHFWDEVDFHDERLVRTPLLFKKLEKYFDQVVVQHPDSISMEADKVIDMARSNKEIFKYCVWYLTSKYETSNIMGFDAVFVHMVNRYYASGEAFWADKALTERLVRKADELAPLLIGKTAPNLILMDTTGGFVSLHHTAADYVVVVFYETDCGHCKKEMDELREFYVDNPFGLQVYAACTDTSLADWKKYVRDNRLGWINVNATRSITADYHRLYNVVMTPTLFVLDRNKTIIAKRLRTEQLIPFLAVFDRNHRNKKD